MKKNHHVKSAMQRIGLIFLAVGLAWPGYTLARNPSPPPIAQAPQPAPSFEKLKVQAGAARDKGQTSEALRLYRKLVALRPEWAEGWWFLGALNYDQSLYDLAVPAFERFVRLEPANGQGWGMLGLCEAQLQRTGSALKHLNKALDMKYGGNQEMARVGRYQQAVLLIRVGEFESALGFLSLFAAEHQRSNSVLDAMGMAILRNSGSVEKLSPEDRLMIREFGQAVFLEGEQKMEEAGQLYGQLEAKYPGKPNVAYACGMNRLLRNRYEEAEKYFKIELERDPRHVAVLLQLTFCSISTSQWEEGYRYAKMATDLAPANGLGYYFLGRIHLRRNEFAQAAAMLENAARLEPETPNIQYSLSQAYSRMNRPQAAARAQAEYERLETLHKQRSGMIFDPRSENPPSSPANQDSRKDATP